MRGSYLHLIINFVFSVVKHILTIIITSIFKILFTLTETFAVLFEKNISWAFSKVNHLETTSADKELFQIRQSSMIYLLTIVRCFSELCDWRQFEMNCAIRNIATNISHDLHQKDNNNNIPVYHQ